MPIRRPSGVDETQGTTTSNGAVAAITEPSGNRRDLAVLPQAITSPGAGTALAWVNGQMSETGNGLVLVGVECAGFLAAILFQDLRQVDAGVGVGCAGEIVLVVLTDLIAAVDQQHIGVTHPLLITAQYDGVEDLIEGLAIAGSEELTAADHGILLHAHGGGKAFIVAAGVAGAVGTLEVSGLGQHDLQVDQGVHQRTAEELGTVTDCGDGRVLGIGGLAVVRLEAGQGAHLLIHDGAVEHRKPCALQFLVIGIDETDRLEAFIWGHAE